MVIEKKLMSHRRKNVEGSRVIGGYDVFKAEVSKVGLFI